MCCDQTFCFTKIPLAGVCGGALSPPTDAGREWGKEDRGTPHQVHDDENTFLQDVVRNGWG